jgi:predicted amidohydrolase
MSQTLRIAAVNWKIRKIRGDAAYFGHLHDLISMAHDGGAQVIVLPELHVLELLSLETELKEHQSALYLVQYAEELANWLKRISDSSGLTIIGGSHFRHVGSRIQNVCAIAVPGHQLIFSAKNNLTRYEREMWDIESGTGLSYLPPKLGVTICYDCEFPEAVRTLAEAGTEVLIVPSWTETIRGHQRVRWSCLARAVENQMYVVHSSLVGGLGYEPIPDSYGSSAIMAPSVEPFPENPVLAESSLNVEQVIFADLDFEQLARSRDAGEVTNWEDRHRTRWTVNREAPVPDVQVELN